MALTRSSADEIDDVSRSLVHFRRDGPEPIDEVVVAEYGGYGGKKANGHQGAYVVVYGSELDGSLGGAFDSHAFEHRTGNNAICAAP